jgi:hypothetical protein
VYSSNDYLAVVALDVVYAPVDVLVTGLQYFRKYHVSNLERQVHSHGEDDQLRATLTKPLELLEGRDALK